MPAGPGKFPVMLVVQEIFGVHEHIKDMCRRYAKMGYFAIAPEMFARQGDVSRMTDIPAILSQVVSKVPDAQVCTDLDATLAFARASGHADAKRTGLGVRAAEAARPPSLRLYARLPRAPSVRELQLVGPLPPASLREGGSSQSDERFCAPQLALSPDVSRRPPVTFR